MAPDIINSTEFKELIKISRSRELHELSQQRFYGHVIVYGDPGIGKTALLEAFKETNPVGYLSITMLRGYEIEGDESLLSPWLLSQLRRPNINAFPELLIIDDFDQILSKSIREKVATLLKEGRKWGFRVILSARKQINEKVFEANAHRLRLRGLNETDVRRLADFFGERSDKHPDLIMTVRDMLSEHQGNPALIISHLMMLVTPDEFAYRNPQIIEELERPKLTVEETPQIITDLRFVNRRILDHIGRRATEVYNLTPRQFEELVAELFDERGYKVQITQQTRDGGKELIILDHREVGNFMIYAECKRYAPDRPVGVSVVSDLIGRMNADRATAGMVVTSSYFSPDAQVFQSKFEHQMSLIDFVKLSTMIETAPPKIIT
ncbi:restriction endonuclease [Mucilaginibacter sp. Bleaf8]|uniref:restriction endonuclease n=1 Tax=Mucilaginibacter sp. Bleaf8 TaxID=2834430 RepID=UPI001BCDDFC8|nr:restriction endonuclease [Mucilaginibacter sp. Bleaf8]MBS7565312.1 restriction endonuclease [Mucilaginibacter sp. Bleaf8]